MKFVFVVFVFVLGIDIARACYVDYYTYQNKCYPCSPGYYCPNGVDQFICPPSGIASGWKNAVCSICSYEYYSSYGGSEECKKCPKGYFCPRRDQEP